MKTYQLTDGDTLVVSVNETSWQTVTFEKKDFADIEAATAAEVADVINRTGGLKASVDEQGNLLLATANAGGHTSLEVDLASSTAAPKLGLGPQQSSAQGAGLRAARLVSLNAEPFALAAGSEMTLVVDDQRRKILFDDGFTNNKATAAEVVKIINAKKKKVADVTRDGRVVLLSNTVGAGSNLKVEPAQEGKKDAASALGLVGTAAFDQPHHVAPASLVCSGPQHVIEVVNLSASPVELHLPAGTALLPAGGSQPLSPGDAASDQLQSLIGMGVLRLISSAKPEGRPSEDS